MAKAKGPLGDANLSEVFLWVRDLPKMRAFYHETLGLAVAYENPRFAELRTRGAGIALHAGRKSRLREESHWFLHFRVRDLNAVVRSLRRRGVKVGRIRNEPFGRVTGFHDPEGNEIGLEEPPW